MEKFFSAENAAQLTQDIYRETKSIARFTGMSTAGDIIVHVDREISDYYLTESGENFVWSMAPGARKCTVDENNNMSIIALEGETNYIEDGSNGAVVLYVPKFFVKEVPLLYRPGADNDYVIVKADYYLSAYRKGGYSTDIIFHNLQGDEGLIVNRYVNAGFFIRRHFGSPFIDIRHSITVYITYHIFNGNQLFCHRLIIFCLLI